VSATALLSSGITIAIANATNLKGIFDGYPIVTAIIKDSGPLIMKAIKVEVTEKLCEMTPFFGELENVADGSDYVTRPSLEDRILKASEKKLKGKGGVYTVLVGPKGAGKSCSVARVFRGKKGVVALSISDADTSASIILKLLTLCGIEVTHGLNIELIEFGPVLLKAAEKRNGLPITFVFEVERSSTSLEILLLIKSFAKLLARKANVIIVLSEANAGLAFGDDERQQVIWVDEMKLKEAEDFARNLHPGVPDADLELLFDKVGKLPLKIELSIAALKDGIPVALIIERAVDAAEKDLFAFTHKSILTALKASLDGVHIRAFDGVKYEGVNLAQPKDVAVAMKKTNAIVYHIPSGEYRLASRAHRTALMQYNPPVEVVSPPVVVK
jgi:hypothetical protein